ncbi:MAG TPA: Rrf2 family transcriptional regulator [Hyphomicrobiales bacterium]|nr:Rrf2 family transcriptional regulator [Hyphomicrobiales bacterium]
MKLQTASRIAIYAVLELARDPTRQLSAAEIGATYSVSVHHLAKVLNTLVRAGLVRSVRGAGGGYMFAGNVKRTTLFDVISLFEPVQTAVGAGRQNEETPAGMALQAILDEIDDISRATLNSVTLATMIKLIDQGRYDAALEPVSRTA